MFQAHRRTRLAIATVTTAVAAAAAAALVLPASAYAAAPIRERKVSVHDATPSKQATVACPAGKVAIGVGGQIVGGDGAVMLTELAPDPQLTSVTARGIAVPGHAGDWSVVAVAACGWAGWVAPVRSGPGSSTATCPAGTVVTGAGFALPSPSTMLLTGLIPSADGASVTVQVRDRAPDHPAPTAYAICAIPLDLDPLSATSPADGSSPKIASVTSDRYPVLGVGGLVEGEPPDVFIDALMLSADLRTGWARATRVRPAAGARLAPTGEPVEDSWSVTVYARAADIY